MEEPAMNSIKTKRSKSRRGSIRDDYFNLIKRFLLAPIRNDRQLWEAHRVLDQLAVKGTKPGALSLGERDYLAVLTDLVEKFEDAHHPMPQFATGTAALAYLLAQHEMSASDLGRLLGNRALGAAILRGERQLSKAHIVQLSQHFKVAADLFLR
jgi:antitoxin component HigA of HigAB toxin-antitoxin module